MPSARSMLAKIAVAFAVLLLISFGLCGIALQSEHTQDLGIIALVGLLIGGVGLVLSGVAAVVLGIVSAVRSRTPPPPPPF